MTEFEKPLGKGEGLGWGEGAGTHFPPGLELRDGQGRGMDVGALEPPVEYGFVSLKGGLSLPRGLQRLAQLEESRLARTATGAASGDLTPDSGFLDVAVKPMEDLRAQLEGPGREYRGGSLRRK